MQDKTVRERATLDKLLGHYKAIGRGEWMPEKGADPPDFLIVNAVTGDRAAVEHTSFIWPPNEISWNMAIQALMEDVRQSTHGAVEGHLVIWIDQQGIMAFTKDYVALSKRRYVTNWLAQQMVIHSRGLNVGQSVVLRGPLTAVLTRHSWCGRGDIRLARSLSRGDDLGFTLAVELRSGRLVRTRNDVPNTVLNSYEEMLRRKAGRLEGNSERLVILVVDDYSMGLDDLIHLSKVMTTPPRINELYVWCARDTVLVDVHRVHQCR